MQPEPHYTDAPQYANLDGWAGSKMLGVERRTIMDVHQENPRSSRRLAFFTSLLFAAMTSANGASAQNLLKPGQGLVGQPEALKAEEPKRKDPTADDDATEMDEVTVKGRHNPGKKLPTLGTDQERKKDNFDKIGEWYNSLAKDPNQLNPESQEFLDATVNHPVDNHTVSGPPLRRRDAADYKDPIATQEKAGK